MPFAWRVPMKAHYYHPDKGGMIVNVEPIQILKEPNRFQMEGIIQALCRSVANLIDIQEEQAKRVAELQAKLSERVAAKVEPQQEEIVAKEEGNGQAD